MFLLVEDNLMPRFGRPAELLKLVSMLIGNICQQVVAHTWQALK